MLDRSQGLARGVALRFGPRDRGGGVREPLLPGRDLVGRGAGFAREPNLLIERLRGFRLPLRQLEEDLREVLVQARHGSRGARQLDFRLVACVGHGDALAARRQRPRAGGLEVPLEGSKGGGRRRRLPVALLAGERTAARLGDRPFQTLLELRELPRHALSLGVEFAGFALERLVPSRKIGGGAAVAVPQRLIALDRRFERGRQVAQPVAVGGGLRGGQPCRGQLRFRARQGGRGLRFLVLAARPEARGFAQRGGELVVTRAGDRGLALPKRRGLLLVARRARGLPLQGSAVALDLRDDV